MVCIISRLNTQDPGALPTPKFSYSPVHKPDRLLKITCFVAIVRLAQRTEAYASAHRTCRA